MARFRYRIAPEIFAAHPGYCRGTAIFDGLDNRGSSAALAPLLREAEAQVRSRIQGNVAEFPRIAAWREAYRKFGAKPSEHRSAIEALSRRALKPDTLPSINPLVDIGNLVSLRHLVPAGMHPIVAGHEEVALRPARPDDRFLPADGAPAETPPAGEIVLAAGSEVLTRRWTWRQAIGTQTLPDTTRVFLNIDAMPPASADDVAAAMEDAIRLVQEYCGGRLVHATILEAGHPDLLIDDLASA